MPHDVFLSHSSKDKGAAVRVCAALEQVGIRVWIAPRDIKPGQAWGESIINAINSCRTMVLILSSASNDSPQVMREVERTVSKRITIIPVRIEDVLPTKSMEYFMGTTHWLDAFGSELESKLKTIVETVQGTLLAPTGEMLPDDAKTVTNPAATENAELTRDRSRWRLVFVGALVTTLIIGIAYLLLLRQHSATNAPTAQVVSQPAITFSPTQTKRSKFAALGRDAMDQNNLSQAQAEYDQGRLQEAGNLDLAQFGHSLKAAQAHANSYFVAYQQYEQAGQTRDAQKYLNQAIIMWADNASWQSEYKRNFATAQPTPNTTADIAITTAPTKIMSRRATTGVAESAYGRPTNGATQNLTDLKFTMTAASWIEVYDASGKRLYYDLYQAGAPLELKGLAPLQVYLGNAPAVTLELNGKPFNITPFVRAGGTAQFKLRSDSSN